MPFSASSLSPPPLLPPCLLSDVHEVRTPDVTGALWRLPPVLCGLAASEASRPVYLSVSSLLFQKGPVAPVVAVTAPQQAPVVMAPQAPAPAQAASQPVQPPHTGMAAAPGGPIVSQVRSLCRPAGAGTVTAASRLAVSQAQLQTHTHTLTQLAADKESHTCPHTFHTHTFTQGTPTQGHAYIHTGTGTGPPCIHAFTH